MLDAGITAAELKAGQNGWLEGQKVERSDDATLARLLNSTIETGRDMRYYGELEQRVLALTADEVGAVWKRNVDPDRIPVAVAGDMAKADAAK
jgi:zinc protease